MLCNNTRVDNADNFNLPIANESIERKNEIQFLCLYLDGKLDWNARVALLNENMSMVSYLIIRWGEMSFRRAILEEMSWTMYSLVHNWDSLYAYANPPTSLIMA